MAGQAQAQVHKCRTAQGGIEYRTAPCAAGTGQPLPIDTQAAAPTGPNAAAAAPSPADAALREQCLGLQARSDTARRQIAEREALARKLSNNLPGALTDAEAREFALLTQRDRIDIEEQQRQGRVAGCGRLGLEVGTRAAAVAVVENRCRQLRDSMQEWLARHGSSHPDVRGTLEAMRQERQREGCKEP
ncbi:MAG: hypothetical protein HY855_25210 [Burkholderiales bacterium]|nr:hypothetical protein [Burkholderiales bacterium]